MPMITSTTTSNVSIDDNFLEEFLEVKSFRVQLIGGKSKYIYKFNFSEKRRKSY